MFQPKLVFGALSPGTEKVSCGDSGLQLTKQYWLYITLPR